MKIIVYTCIINNYDKLKEPKVIDDDVEYICYTNNDLVSKTWKIKKIPIINNDPVRTCREIKINCLHYANADVSIWVDGSIEIKKSLNNLIESIKENDLVVFKHPERNCIYQEANMCVRLNKDHKVIIENQMDEYRNSHYPINNGLIESNIFLVNHKNAHNIQTFMRDWIFEVNTKSRRDQLSFNYVLEKHKNIINCKFFEDHVKYEYVNWNKLHN